MDVHEFEFADFPQLIRQRLEHHGLAQGKVALDLAHPGAAQIAPGMLTAAEFFSLSGQLPKARFENGVDVIDDLMLIKDAAEIERLRHAAEVSDYGFEQGMMPCGPAPPKMKSPARSNAPSGGAAAPGPGR